MIGMETGEGVMLLLLLIICKPHTNTKTHTIEQWHIQRQRNIQLDKDKDVYKDKDWCCNRPHVCKGRLAQMKPLDWLSWPGKRKQELEEKRQEGLKTWCFWPACLPASRWMQLDHHKLPFLSSPYPYQLITLTLSHYQISTANSLRRCRASRPNALHPQFYTFYPPFCGQGCLSICL